MRSNQKLLMSYLLSALTVSVFVFSPSSYAQASGVDELPRSSGHYELANSLSIEIASRLGISTKPPLVLFGYFNNRGLADRTGRTAEELNGMEVFAIAAPIIKTGEKSRPQWTRQSESLEDVDREGLNTCGIFLHVRFELSDDLMQKVYLAHELTHCYQMLLTPNLGTYGQISDWLREGSAQFVGEDIGRLGSRALPVIWDYYLGDGMPLFSRSYDAMGLFFHMKHRGVDPYQVIREVVADYRSDPDALRQIRTEMGDRNFSSWPMSLSRHSDWGTDWDTNGLRISSRRTEEASINLPDVGRNYSTTLDPGGKPLYSITFPSDKILRLELTGYGAIRWNPDRPDSATEFFQGTSEASYCISGGCRCPDGTLPPGIIEVPGTGGSSMSGAFLAISGDGVAGSINATILDTPACPSRLGSCKLLTVTSKESKLARKSLCGQDLAEGDCIVGQWHADSEAYARQMTERLPRKMRVIEARNDTTLSIMGPGKAIACISFEAKTEMSGPVSVRTHTYANGASISVLGLKSDNILCAQPVKEEVDTKATVSIAGVETEQAIKIPTKLLPRESRFECNENRLRIYGQGDQYTDYTRIQ